jgi:hypothetical protein
MVEVGQGLAVGLMTVDKVMLCVGLEKVVVAVGMVEEHVNSSLAFYVCLQGQ